MLSGSGVRTTSPVLSRPTYAKSGTSPSQSQSFAYGSPAHRSSVARAKTVADVDADEVTKELREVWRRIDTDCDGYASQLDLIRSVQQHTGVAQCVLPGVDRSLLMSNECSFDALDAVFHQVARGKGRMRYTDFMEYFRRQKAGKQVSKSDPKSDTARAIFTLIDRDKSGEVSRLELVDAVRNNKTVSKFALPIIHRQALDDEAIFDAARSLFDAIAEGKKRFDFADFQKYCSKAEKLELPATASIDRSSIKVFIIGPGFGLQLNPRQGATIQQAGFQIRWCHDVPNPEQPNFPVQPYLDQIKAQMNEFQPDVVAAASKGGVYATGLWQVGYWTGPTLILNAHPTLTQIPENASLVLAHGSNDEVYPTPREDLEALIARGAPDRCFLYYTANSGYLSSGQLSRLGDRHNMESLLQYDLLPRLIDALISPAGPELHMVRTWRDRLSEERLEAEAWLGYTPDRLRRLWSSYHRKGLDGRKLFDVPPGSEEFLKVASVFHAAPREPPAYMLSPQAVWDKVNIVRLQRVENGLQMDGCIQPYYASLCKSLAEQGMDCEPGVHTAWAFHGADDVALESIVSNPVAGFQPLASGSRGASVWGLGTYFAREAKYVADGGFCGAPGADGHCRMLMCLLSTGMACLGDPQHKGVLPVRKKPHHRYHCSVDSLSSPEIYIVQHAGAAQPAYLITYA